MSHIAALRVRAFLAILCILVVSSHSSMAASMEQPRFQFDRMWPMLSQPWSFNDPIGVAVHGSVVYVCDSLNERVNKYTVDGQLIASLAVQYPFGLATDAGGNVYVADEEGIAKYDPAGTFVAFISTQEENGAGGMQPVSPADVAVRESGDIYVVSRHRLLVQQYDANGGLVRQWAEEADNRADADRNGIAVGADGGVYVSDFVHDTVRKYTAEGDWLLDFARPTPADGSIGFDGPAGIAVDANGFVYVADLHNERVLRFTGQGLFDTAWQIESLADPSGVAIDSTGNIYITEVDADRISKFTSYGSPITQWCTSGNAPGLFSRPEALVLSQSGDVYVADTSNGRVQVFSGSGEFRCEWRLQGGFEPGRGMSPRGIAVDAAGYVYVSNDGNEGAPILRFDADTSLDAEWGLDEDFGTPEGIALDSLGNVYATDAGSDSDTVRVDRVLKYSPSGQLVAAWGEFGHGGPTAEDPYHPVQFAGPRDIAIDGEGNVYVTDEGNCRVQKFTSSGEFLLQWGVSGEGDGQLTGPRGVDIDANGNICVVDTNNTDVARIEVFRPDGTFLYSLGGSGENAGEFSEPAGIAIGTDGRIYVADAGNDRVQVFREAAAAGEHKAIVVAGGGPFADASLWPSTQMLANFAYRSLRYQGFSPEMIRYLTSNQSLDLDNDVKTVEVAGDATVTNLAYAITDWATQNQTENVIVYLTGPGVQDLFRINEAETVSAATLGAWLDTLQSTIAGSVVVIYDASEAGNFVTWLAPKSENGRVVIASASAEEPAYFVTNGTLSFSNQFWLGVFNGLDIYDAFEAARDAIGGSTAYQHPQLDANGNGIGNEPEDAALAAGLTIMLGARSFDEAPVVAAVSPPQVLSEDQTAAAFFAGGVTDDRAAVARVWAVITPPGGVKAGDAALVDLPSFDLVPGDEDSYTGTFDGFEQPGEYEVDIYAMDGNLNISVVQRTTVTKAGILPGTVLCTVWDDDASDHVPITNATVTVTPIGLSITENIEGVYTFADIPAGTYTILVVAPGYEDASRTATVASGAVVRVDFPIHQMSNGEGEGESEGEGEGPSPGCIGPALTTGHSSTPSGGLRGDILVLSAVLTLLVSARKGKQTTRA